MIIKCLLGIVVALLVYYSGIKVSSKETLYNSIGKNCIIIVFVSFFFLTFIYCIIGFYRNLILNPKQEILYLYKNDKNEIYFINEKEKNLMKYFLIKKLSQEIITMF